MLLCTFHIGESLIPSYSAPLGSPRTLRTMRGGLSQVYVDLAKQPLRSWLDSNAPGWTPPLILVGWSAGCFAARDWLRSDPEAHGLIDAIVMLDGLHSSGPPCRADQIAGVVEFSRDPSKLLVVTHSSIVPGTYASTTDCAQLLRSSQGWLSQNRNVHILGYPGDDAEAHVRQVREVGPEVMRSIVAPWAGEADPEWQSAAVAVVLLAVAGGVAWYVLRG
jgi:hypothetical protein